MRFHHKKLSFSQFTRDKLHEDYNPILSAERYKHFIDIDRKRKFMTQVKDQLKTSNRALSEIKKGNYLQIDMNTRLNFKSVTQLRTQVDDDYEWSTDKYKKATFVISNELQKMQEKKRSLHQKMKQYKQGLSVTCSIPALPTISNNKIKDTKLPNYKKRVLKRQKELLKMYPLKFLKPQLLQKFNEIYAQMM